MKQSKAKPRIASKFNVNQLSEQPLFATNPQAALLLLAMNGQAQLSIDDLLGQLSRQFIEQLLVLSAETWPAPSTPAVSPVTSAGTAHKAEWLHWGKASYASSGRACATVPAKWLCQPIPRWLTTASSRLASPTSWWAM